MAGRHVRTRRLVAAALLVLPAAACGADEPAATPQPTAGRPRVTARLAPVDGSDVRGVLTLTDSGFGTYATIDVTGLQPRTTSRGVIDAGTCDEPGASPLALPALTSNADGEATATADLKLRDEDVAFETLADGEHVVRVVSDDADLACGEIPAA